MVQKILLTSFLAVRLILPNTPLHALSAAYAFLPGFPRFEFHSISNSGPAVLDLNRDGRNDIVIADDNGCVWAWDARGNVLAGFPLQTNGACDYTPRIDGPLAIGDLDNDGTLEIVAGTRGVSNAPGQRGKVFVWKASGTLMPGFPQEIAWSADATADNLAEVYTVALANVSGDANLEIIAGTSNNSTSETGGENVYVWNANGVVLAGFPTKYRGAGIWGYIAAADLTGDGHAEIITGRDQLYLHAYQANGQQLAGWPLRTYVDPTKTNYDTDRYMEYTTNAPAIGDLDNDGTPEIVIAGKVRDPLQGHAVTNLGVLVSEPNGSRRAGWTLIQLVGAPLSDALQPKQAPALADLDNDGKLEIVIAFADGTVRAFRENGNSLWTYDFAQGRRLYPSEPVIGDVNGDGQLDVIVGTYSPDGSANSFTGIIGLSANGVPLAGFPLALAYEGTKSIQGIRAAPALADVNGDCYIEIVAGSLGGALYVWTLPFAYNAARMPWSISRHDFYRSGSTQVAAPVQTCTPSAPAPVFLPYVKK